MASFISILSLFVLVLASGYYTAPVIHETTSLSNELGRETTEVPKHIPRSSDGDVEPEVTTPEGTTEEIKSEGLRLVPDDDKDGLSTPETHTQEPREIPNLPDTSKFPSGKIPEQHQSSGHSHGGESESAEETGKEKTKPGHIFQQRGMPDESTTTTTPMMPTSSTSSSTIVPQVPSESSTSTVKYTGLLKDDEPRPTESERPERPIKPRPTEGERPERPIKPRPTEGERPEKPIKSRPTEGERPEKPIKPRPTEDEQPEKPIKSRPTEDEQPEKPIKSRPTEDEQSEKPNKPRPKPEEPTENLGAVFVDSQSVPDLGNGSEGVMRFDDNTIPSITDPSTSVMEGKSTPKPIETPLNEGEKPSQSEEKE